MIISEDSGCLWKEDNSFFLFDMICIFAPFDRLCNHRLPCYPSNLHCARPVLLEISLDHCACAY